MRKNKQLLILILLSVCGISYSQLTNFNLSDYKLPDLDRKSLETRFDLTGYNNSATPSQDYIGAEKTGSNQYVGNFYLNYNHYLTNAKRQRLTNMGLNFSSSLYSNKADKELNYKNNAYSPSLYYERENRVYHRYNNFIETDFSFHYKYDNNYRFSKGSLGGADISDKLQNHSLLALVPLKAGVGRIEQVEDARHAVYLFEELAKVERVAPSKTDQEVIEFAEFISKLKNKRFFDTRLKRIAELESIDSFLISHDYLLKSDAKYFATLGDYWDYGDKQIRYSGTRFSGVVMPGYYLYNYFQEGNGIYFTPGRSTISAFLLTGGVELKHEKPINLFWQHSIELNGYIGIMEGNINDMISSNKMKLRVPNLQLGYSQTIGFYPNTRTDISIGYSVKYVQLYDRRNMENNIIGVEGKGLKAATNLSINYYISPKFRLNIMSNFYYIWQESKDNAVINFETLTSNNYLLGQNLTNINGYSYYFNEKELHNYFTISLMYSIF